MPETIESPEVVEAPEFAAAEADFNKAIGATRETPNDEPAPEPKPESKGGKPAATESGIPEHVLTGEKPEEKKPEPTEIEKVLALEKPIAGQGHWNLVKEHALKLQQQLEERTKEIETLKASPKVDRTEIDAELKTHREKVAEIQAVLERKAFEESPRYKAMLSKEESFLKAAKGYLDGGEVDPGVIDIAARQKGQQRLKTLEDAGMSPATIAAITSTLSNIDILSEERANALANHREELAKETEAEKARALREEQQERETQTAAFKKKQAELSTKLAPLQKVEGATEWNAQADAVAALAEKIFHGDHTPEEFAEFAHKAAAYGVQEKIVDTLRSQNKALREENAKLKGQQPSVNGARKDGSSLPYDPANPPSLEQRAMSDFDTAMAAARG